MSKSLRIIKRENSSDDSDLEDARHHVIDENDIIKEGFIYKESRFLKKWKQRWLVITNTHALTFENKRADDNPTEVVKLKTRLENFEKVPESEIKVKHAFRLVKPNRSLIFQAES